MRKKYKWWLTILVLVGAVGFGTYNLLKDKSPDRDEGPAVPVGSKPNVLNVNAQIIERKPLVDEIRSIAILMPDEEVDLSFETSGKIVEIHFKEGSPVKKGQLLAKVNDKPLLAQLSKYEAQVKLAEDRLYRQSTLLKKDAVSQEAYEQARTELATLHADIDLVKANIAQTELRAPFDGVIGLRNVSEGAYASPSVVVAKLTKLSPLKLEFTVPESYSSQIHNGMPLTFQIDKEPKPLQASIYAVAGSLTGNRTLTVRALYPNKDQKLIPGRFAMAQIRLKEIADAIAIPSQALVPELGIDKVFLFKNGTAQPVEVKTGLRTESQVQIVSGLQTGDTLITSGTLQLRTGLKVKLDNIEKILPAE